MKSDQSPVKTNKRGANRIWLEPLSTLSLPSYFDCRLWGCNNNHVTLRKRAQDKNADLKTLTKSW